MFCLFLESPTSEPTEPTHNPTLIPSHTPSALPTGTPTVIPTLMPSFVPSDAPTDAPTLSPTSPPTVTTLAGAISEQDMAQSLQYTIGGIGGISIIMSIIAVADSKCRSNELLNIKAVLVFAFYTTDFVSDIFFTLKLFLLGLSDGYYFFLCIASFAFIVIPLFVNITQLHKEMKKWAELGVSRWIKSRMMLIYMISVVCGSSFSAISLFNSYLFRLPVFCMGLSKHQGALFEHKRFFSIVLLEVKFNCLHVYTVH